MEQINPNYSHDCENCQFLGDYNDQDNLCDLYLCGNGSDLTVISRHSNSPSDYQSGIVFALLNDGEKSPLKEALFRAYKNDLIKITFNQ